MALKTRDALLAKEKFKIERVDFPDGDHAFVREMSGRQKEEWEKTGMQEVVDANGKFIEFKRVLEDYRAKLAVFTVCNEEGVLIFRKSDVEMLSQNMSAKNLTLIANKAGELNKITEEEQLKLVKNSEGDQVADSSSDSVEN